LQQAAQVLAVGRAQGLGREVDAGLAPGQVFQRFHAQVRVQHLAARRGHAVDIGGRQHGQIGQTLLQGAQQGAHIGLLVQAALLAQPFQQALVGGAEVEATHHHHAQFLAQQQLGGRMQRGAAIAQGNRCRPAVDQGHELAQLVSALGAGGGHDQIGLTQFEHAFQPGPGHMLEAELAAMGPAQAAQQLRVSAANLLAFHRHAQAHRAHRHLKGA